MSLAERLAGLDGIGIRPSGVNRLAWTPEDAACRRWFTEQAEAAGLQVESDPAGNLWACPDAEGPWWAVGSHLDSVRDGGRFDGPLGVAAGFEIAGASEMDVAVICLADEEGARFNTPTFGSKALAGALDLPAVLERSDPEGITLGAAMRQAGHDPDLISDAPAWLERLRGFIEVHIDQTLDLERDECPVGVISTLASRMRLEVSLTGRADHAGTTPPSERRDALGAAARLIVAAEDLGANRSGMTVTSSRMLVEPNASTTVAAHVRLWIDARSADMGVIEAWLDDLHGRAAEIADRARVLVELQIASRSVGQAFSEDLRTRLGRAAGELLDREVPELVCFAGHDAGVLASRIPAAMVLVRNPNGVSHSPEERVSLDDAEWAVRTVARALDSLADGERP